jgi:phage-related minor tail protein
MSGIGNALVGKQTFSGVAGQLQHVNEQIDVTEKKVNALKNNGLIGGLIDDLAGNDITLEKNRLDSLYKQQEKLAGQLKDSLNPTASIKLSSGPSTKDVSDFINSGSGKGKGHHARKAALTDEQKAAEKLQNSYESMLASLQKEIDLRDKNTEVAQVEYEIISGSLKGLAPLQQENLLGLAKEKDALETQEKQWAALVESANDYYDLRQSNDELIRSGDIQSGFGDALAKTQDQLKLGTINSDQAKAEFDKLGKAWNDEFITPAKEGTDALTQFSIQAARNMQDSFANFLFDPFNTDMGGLLDNFTTALRKMAAEAASAAIFDSLMSKKSGGGGGLDSLVSGAASLFSAFAAKGHAFNHGNIVAFAGGGVVTSPHTFPMAGGRTGLMGEAGPEAIMPLARGSDGKLGIKTRGGQGHTIIVNVNGGSAPDVRRAAGQGAREALGLINGAGRYG